MELFIIRDGQQTGPFSEETVQTMLKQGELRRDDMGWRKGLPAWLPLSEFFQTDPKRRSEPPPINGSASGTRARPATARQKALLQYIGTPFSGQTTREEAALAISEAMENPKLTSRLAKWGDEKLRLHPDLFQEEIDYRRANRITRYLELCQTEGVEVVKDITKAHVQVLMESLDKRQVGWDAEPRSALWDYLLPTVAEHFPQLVQEEWKGKLKFGGTSKVAAAYAGLPATGVLVPGPAAHPSALQAIIRGVVYGVVALGLVLAGIYLFKDTGKSDIARSDKPAPAAAALPETEPPADAEGNAALPENGAVPAEAEAVHPTKVPLIGAEPTDAVAAAAPAETPSLADRLTGNVPAVPMADAAQPAPVETSPVPAMKAAADFTPAPPPPGVEPVAQRAPLDMEAPAAATPAVRNSATLIQPVSIQLQFGKVTLPPGTRVRLIALEGANARVNFNNNIVLVPVASTDIDPANTIVAAAPAPTVTLPIPPATPPASVTPAPTSSLAPKPLPSADL